MQEHKMVFARDIIVGDSIKLNGIFPVTKEPKESVTVVDIIQTFFGDIILMCEDQYGMTWKVTTHKNHRIEVP